jgi:hypothetical protein
MHLNRLTMGLCAGNYQRPGESLGRGPLAREASSTRLDCNLFDPIEDKTIGPKCALADPICEASNRGQAHS